MGLFISHIQPGMVMEDYPAITLPAEQLSMEAVATMDIV